LNNEARFEKYGQQKEQEFDDLLKGKSSKDKNLQELFADFLDKAKTTEFKKPLGEKMNSARSSIGSMGSKLEQRR